MKCQFLPPPAARLWAAILLLGIFPSLAQAADIGISQVDSLSKSISITEGSHPLSVTLQNHGTDTVTPAQIYWRLNGDSPQLVNWSGASLLPGATVKVLLASPQFDNGKVSDG